jgi:ring-1,2-phenylacetyl-CoA epoxidase subunit PaaC
MSLSSSAREYLLAFADDEHMIGARHTSWIGMGPFLGEDLAFCSIAQDEIGHAIALYQLVLDDGQDLDTFALFREPHDYRSCWAAEVECRDWNDALVRHWLYDRAETLRWQALTTSSHRALRAVAVRAMGEEAFHVDHAEQFMSRIAPNDPAPIIGAINRLLPLALGLWDRVTGETEVVADGLASGTSAELGEQWRDQIRTDLVRWELDIAWPDDAITGRQHRRTIRSDGFGALQADLKRVMVLEREAVW